MEQADEDLEEAARLLIRAANFLGCYINSLEDIDEDDHFGQFCYKLMNDLRDTADKLSPPKHGWGQNVYPLTRTRG